MKIFLDTSSLIKLYCRETDTEHIESVFVKNEVEAIFISEIAFVEFESSLWKKVREKDITASESSEIIRIFDSELYKYFDLPIDSNLLRSARGLIATHGISGLRSLDSIQLATALLIREDCDLFVASEYTIIDCDNYH